MMSQSLRHKAVSLKNNTKEQKRFIKFAMVGAFGMLIDLTVLNILVLLFGLQELAANPISVATAILSNFLLNRYWSFPESRSRPLWPQLRQYALINVAGLLFNQLIFTLMLKAVVPRLPVVIAHPWDYNLSKVIAIGIVLFWNYGVNRLTTYRGL